MQATSTRYEFKQRFRVPARQAYEWCTDYRTDDLSLMGEKGYRGIQRLTEDTLILTESVRTGTRTVRKRKLVKLNPKELRWYNVQLEGPFKHSTFLYHIQPEGTNASRLRFTGLIVIYSKKKLPSRRVSRIAHMERKFDAHAWVSLAKAMEREIATRK
ncbi:MAG TPA: hypothetical protein VLV18_04090 [Terriglobales bacterium]|nr:hypothetical protein [Terriglobales bacterium]